MLSIGDGTANWGETVYKTLHSALNTTNAALHSALNTTHTALNSLANATTYVLQQGKEWGPPLSQKAQVAAEKIQQLTHIIFTNTNNFIVSNPTTCSYAVLTLGTLGIIYALYTCCYRTAPKGNLV